MYRYFSKWSVLTTIASLALLACKSFHNLICYFYVVTIQELLESLSELQDQSQDEGLNLNQRDAVLRVLQYLCGPDRLGPRTATISSTNRRVKVLVLATDGMWECWDVVDQEHQNCTKLWWNYWLMSKGKEPLSLVHTGSPNSRLITQERLNLCLFTSHCHSDHTFRLRMVTSPGKESR